jgi:hypothetical protein
VISTKMYKILIYNGQVLHFTAGHRQSPCCIPIGLQKGGGVQGQLRNSVLGNLFYDEAEEETKKSYLLVFFSH